MTDFKPRPGSQLAAETKEDKIFVMVAAFITVLLWFTWFVFHTDQHLFVKRASLAANFLGSVFIFGSAVYLWVGAKRFWDAKGVVVWAILLAFGLSLSTGFNMDYFGTTKQEKVDNGGDRSEPAEVTRERAK